MAALGPAEREWLSEAIHYLNMAELRRFCEARFIPYRSHVETVDGRVVQSRDADRKGVLINRLLHFLNTGAVKPKTIFDNRLSRPRS
jgi:hypothetical protein